MDLLVQRAGFGPLCPNLRRSEVETALKPLSYTAAPDSWEASGALNLV